MNKLFCNKEFSRFVLLIAIVFSSSILANSATFTVTSHEDRDDVCTSGLNCSLREAIKMASSAAGDDIIEFSPNLTLITLTSEIKIQVPSGSISINGRGADIFTIDGGAGNNRIFSTIFANVSISGMTLTGGNGRGENRDGFGGAIHTDGGSLALDRVNVTGNTTGSAGGGVIFENGTYRVTNSTFSANSAFNCGGISNSGAQVTIVNTTISGNTVSQQGGGLCANGNTTLRQVTITNNTASNGSGLLKAASGTLNIGNTILAGNSPDEIRFNAGEITSVGNNIIGDSPGEAANTGFMSVVYHPSDILDKPPMLGPLQNNGGATRTHAPALHSPAIDAGNNSLAVNPNGNLLLSTDQRGFNRIKDGDGNGTAQVDIGAYELRSFFVTNINDSGNGSLRQTILDTASEGDALGFTGSLFDLPQIIILTSGELVIPNNANFTINGTGADNLTISGNNQSRVFMINAGAKVTISGVTITGGSGGGEGFYTGVGGGILNLPGGILILIDSNVSNNKARGSGGGIHNDGTMIITNSIISNNIITGAGLNAGGIYNGTGTLTINNSTISGNSAQNDGSGVMNSFGTVTLNNSIVSGNYGNSNSSGFGGGIYNKGGTFTINSSSIISNTVRLSGGGIYNAPNSIMNISKSNIRNNSVTFNGSSGAGIRNDGTLTVTESTVSNNSAIAGAGIDQFGGITKIVNSTVSGNRASQTGGGIRNASNGAMSIKNSTVSNNSAQFGGGIANNGVLSAQNSIIADNTTTSSAPDFSGALTSEGYNLIENTSGTTITGTTTGNILAVDPQLLPLGNYGGLTQTHALRSTSPAIDKGKFETGIITDQRGFPRPINFPLIPNATGGNGSDIGAYERQSSDITGNTSFDFDGDGKTDVSIYRPSLGEWWYQKSSNGGNGAFQFGSSTDKLVPADYTGDGKTDVAFWRPSSGQWFILRSEDNSFYAFPFGASGDTPAPADYDGDGKADAAVFRASSATWFIARSTGGTTIQQFGANGDVPVVADYDGDNKADIAIYRPSLGQWWLLRSTAGVIAFQFGANTDKPVQGDYTGDGKADVAFFRPSTGEWFILRSENNSFYAFPFGTNGDIPSPGDYDGDGKTDAAVFRPSNSTWYVQRSTSGTMIQGFGQTGDTPVPNAFVP